MNTIAELKKGRLPRHLAIIMDGNGRWAKQRGKLRVFGHQNGVEAVRQTVETAAKLEIPYLTLYAFSTENWKRPKLEVDTLMRLLVASLKKEIGNLISRGVTEAQFNYGKERAKGKLLMSTEGTLQTLSRFLDDVVICGKPDSLEDLIARIEALTIDDINDSIKRHIAGPWNVSLLLPEQMQNSTFLTEEHFEI